MAKYLLLAQHKIAIDGEGYLKNLEDWSQEVAGLLAENEGMQLQSSHWEVIESLRAFYKAHQLSPATRALVNLVKRDLGAEKGRSIYLMKLFKASPAKLACKIAGLPRPDNCL